VSWLIYIKNGVFYLLLFDIVGICAWRWIWENQNG